MKETMASRMMNETILYGGLPLRRCDVHRDVLARTGSAWAADMAAFSPRHEAVDYEPLSLAEFQGIFAEAAQ